MGRLFSFFSRPVFQAQSSERNMENPSKIGDCSNGIEVPIEFENSDESLRITRSTSTVNVIDNHDFSAGLDSWHPNWCKAFVCSPDSSCIVGKPNDVGGKYAVVTARKETWQGLEQDITARVSAGPTYTVAAHVGVQGAVQGISDVIATLRLEYRDSNTTYVFIGRKSVSEDCWEMVEGTFSLSTMPEKVVFYLEGPPPGVNLLIKSVLVSGPIPTSWDSQCKKSELSDEENIISNFKFDDGLNNWSGRGCKILLHESMGDGKVVPQSGKFFASATERTQTWHGIQQDITGKANRKLAYEVAAIVRLFGPSVTNTEVRATLWLQFTDQREQYIGVAKVQASDKDWVQMQGKFLINGSPSQVTIFIEGAPPGIDILLNSLVIKHAPRVPPPLPPMIENEAFGVNIISNSNLSDGTNGWFPLGNCNLSVGNGSPHILPPMAMESLGAYQPLSGRYILVKNRSQLWMGPAQMITDKVKPFLTYQVAAWIRLGSGSSSATQNVNIALNVDDQWVNGGQVEIGDDRWHEVGGAFRIEKQPSKVMVYIQGPAPGIDFMVAGLQIFPVDRQARFKSLRRQTDKIRKRDVVLKLSGSDSVGLAGTLIRVKQTQNNFPFGSCLMRTNMDNEDFTDFFVKNFNWAVFGNELKWYWTEAQQGVYNYKEADELLEFCTSHNIPVRGHCIFWEVDNVVQQWIKNLNKTDLAAAVQNRLTGLLSRYKGKFPHYDVNNEMLHGSFFQDRLGKEIRVNMFKTANQLDPTATLFVNDYHVEDYSDTRSYPEKYIEQVLDLQEQGAPVGGVGIQGHIENPVGPIVRNALNKLGILGLPLWFTELDFSSVNEYVRADDLEVMLREIYAHPAVEGVMLWGFWELFMSRENSHLVNAEGDLNEAGRRYLALKDEWLTHAHGHVDENGQFCFRGFQGSYELEICVGKKRITKTFVVDKGEEPAKISIAL